MARDWARQQGESPDLVDGLFRVRRPGVVVVGCRAALQGRMGGIAGSFSLGPMICGQMFVIDWGRSGRP